jgi:DNA-binding transcriptional MerR regulator
VDKSPDAFRTISEVADHLDTPAHVLRFWESRFPQIRPVKRAGGRRYYRPSDVALLGGIKRLLHEDGMTIRGVQKVLREHGVRHVQALSGESLADLPDPAAPVELAMAAPAAPAAAEIIPFVIPVEPAESLAESAAAAPADQAAHTDGEWSEGAQTEPEPSAADLPDAAETEAAATEAPIGPQPAAADGTAPLLPPAEPGPATLPFLQPRPTPAPPMPELPLFSAPAAARPLPATLAELRERLRTLAPGSLAHRHDDVMALARRLHALLPGDAPQDAA